MSTAPSTTPDRDTTTELVARIWRDLFADPQLKLDEDDDFFALGASSMLAMTLVERLRAEFHVQVGMVSIIDNSRLGDLADHIHGLLCEQERGEL
jgi:aryl carrier-like protein